ncbi:MAG: hypothetical protein K2O05_02930 [Anaeroplasmataceae bacterium]|nr:hypothetical protein [Anaeroplasmataceae bacterium]MDE7100787.1 hypothetical protein [Anaeroplasmataceae bacterium]
MTQFFRKNAKLLYILFAIFAFAFIIIACIFMTPFYDVAVDYTVEYVFGGKPEATSNSLLQSFFILLAARHGFNYETLFKSVYEKMYSATQALQAANRMYVVLSVTSLIMIAIMLICANASRKKFYISNLVSGVACPTVIIVLAIVTMVYTGQAMGHITADTDHWLGLGAMANAGSYKEALELYGDGRASEAAISPNSLIVYMIILGLFIVASIALIAYNVFRYLDTQKQLRAEAKTDCDSSNDYQDELVVDAIKSTDEDENVALASETEESLEKVVDANV